MELSFLLADPFFQSCNRLNSMFSSDELIFLEVFAGSANLSEAVRHKGLLVHAIDDKMRRQSKVSIHVFFFIS